MFWDNSQKEIHLFVSTKELTKFSVYMIMKFLYLDQKCEELQIVKILYMSFYKLNKFLS